MKQEKASLAQLVEQLTLNQFVRGSSPRGGTESGALAPLFVSYDRRDMRTAVKVRAEPR